VLSTAGRHGPSFFARVRHPEVEYEAGTTLTFDRYHTVDVMYEWLERWAARYPELVQLYQVGTSYEGRPIMQVTVTNTATGAASEKPAAYFEGGRHSGEITASESVLFLIQRLVEGYGVDPEVTALLDRVAVYLRPQNNPDGSNLYLHTAQTNRSSVRPIDNDGDGLTDEDPANDLDGDGVILQMRWRDAEGNFDLDPRDPKGRLMMRVEDGAGSWSMGREGFDDDGDGRSDEDGVGGLDLHRNYPTNWRPDSGRDRSERGWTQFGAGAYPLSEPETRATVLFVLENPNISVVNSMDTSVPMHLRGPSTSTGEESMFPEDLAYYEFFDSVGVSITDYPWSGDVYHDYSSRGNPDREGGTPLFGHGPDFGYFSFGAIWYGDELWNGGRIGDMDGDGTEDEYDRLLWQDSITGGRAFKAWTAFDHPERGPVEIGGWHPKFFNQNGPPEVLSHWAGNEAQFNFFLAQSLPDLSASSSVRRADMTDDSTTWEVTITVSNAGRLPTALRQAALVKIVRPDRLVVRLENARTGGESPEVRFVSAQGQGGGGRGGGRGGGGRGGGRGGGGRGGGGANNTTELGYLQPGESRDVVLQIRSYGLDAISGSYELISTRGGIIRGVFSSDDGARSGAR